MANVENLMDKIVSLCKRRGFIFPGSEIYGGLAGTWDYGPLGVLLKQNIRREWWRTFVHGREDIFGVDSAILMHPGVWKASGHVTSFVDPMIDCRSCKQRFRGDTIDPAAGCPNCGAKDLTAARPFNMMFKTHAGPVEDTAAETYLRPETAQGMFVNFKNVLDSMHPKLPFGIAQIGKAFRNEITPGNFIFRTREFEQMEIEYFIRPPASGEWEASFESWRAAIHGWADLLGITLADREVPESDRAHYSRRTIDFDFDFPFGREELCGLAYRADFDLQSHAKASGTELSYFDEETKERIVPHVIEPTFGVDRTVLALLVAGYREEEDKDGVRTVLRLPARLAPHQIAVFPLLANKPPLVEKAREVYRVLKAPFAVSWDDIGNIGKRYRRQDEIGTPWCVTVDFDTLEDGTVTVRDRDTMQQERVLVADLSGYFLGRLNA